VWLVAATTTEAWQRKWEKASKEREKKKQRG